MTKEEICDKILELFKGDKSFSWDQIREFPNSIPLDYYEIENYIKFLIGENMLRQHEFNGKPYIAMTEKGWFVMTNVITEGYVAQKLNNDEVDNRNISTLRYAKWATIFAGLSLLCWVIDKLFFNNNSL